MKKKFLEGLEVIFWTPHIITGGFKFQMTSSSTATAYCYRMLLKNKLKKALHMVSTCLRFEPKHLLQVQYILALGSNIKVMEKPIFLSINLS